MKDMMKIQNAVKKRENAFEKWFAKQNTPNLMNINENEKIYKQRHVSITQG